jgi:hypothetical protein
LPFDRDGQGVKMRTFWTGIARVLAILFTVSFVILALVSILILQFEKRIWNAETYQNALEEQQVFDRMPRVIAEQLIMAENYNPCAENPLLCESASPELQGCAKQALGEDRYKALTEGQEKLTPADQALFQHCLQQFPLPTNQPQGGGPPLLVEVLTVSDWETLIAALLPSQDLKSIADSFLDQLFRYLNKQQDQVVISLTQIKGRIAGPEGLNALLTIIRAQPACTDVQITTILYTVESGGTNIEMCAPPEEILVTLKPILQNQLELLSEQIPYEATVIKPQDTANASPLAGISIRWVHFSLRASPLLPLLMLLFISLFAVRTPKSWLRWWGIPFFVSGLLTLGVGASLPAIFNAVWVNTLAQRVPAYISLGLITLGHDLFASVLHTFSEGIVIAGLILGLVGLGMWVGSCFVKDRQPEPLPISE